MGRPTPASPHSPPGWRAAAVDGTANHRFAEVTALAGGDVFTVSDNPADHIDAERIAACLKAGMAGARIGTIVVDSLTAILSPLVATAVMANDAGQYQKQDGSLEDPRRWRCASCRMQ